MNGRVRVGRRETRVDDDRSTRLVLLCPPSSVCPYARRPGPLGGALATPTQNRPLSRRRHQVALPCCRNQFGTLACRGLRRSQADIFEYRCLNDHDFHTIDCCMECRDYIETHKIHPQNAKPIFKAPWHCKDTHSFAFCRKFRTSGMGKYSCSTPEFAMRVCRMTCGYCDDKLYSYDKAAPPC
uniref:ShKT domain-containing protein n=1 Tax=Plectus sambesii TaxID=2011161 RepID=A0A914WTA5_9BILA